jgi:hypothetical protein
MIDAVLSVLKPIGAPGSIPFLVIGLVVALAMTFVWPRSRRAGRYWLMSLLTFYLLMALPIVAKMVSGALPGVTGLNPRAITPLDSVVVFDGDNRRGRVATTSQLVAMTRPREVWVLGLEADWIRDTLPSAGVPAEMVHAEFGTGTTRLQLDWVVRRLSHNPHERLAIVASRLQVPRIAGMARAMRLDVPVIGAPVDDEPPASGMRVFVPTDRALRVSRDALYEHAAVAYYRSRGWIVP